MIDVRIAESRDAGAVADLVGQLMAFVGAPVAERAGVALADALLAETLIADIGAATIIVAEDAGEIVGVCTLTYQTTLRMRGRYAILQEMFVVPAHRSAGLGSRIVQRALAEAQAHGCRSVELGTPGDGDRQAAFYGRLGFSVIS
jgi:GNAT superfamily N-acetyltransferase